MTKTILIIPDQHAHHSHDNNRADWAGKFILDLKPDIVVNIGDAADMASLSSYDKGRRSFHGKTYLKDIESHLDFQERLWHPVRKAKKRLPQSFFFEGNHEYRIEKALDLSPELEGTLDFSDFEFDFFYDEVIRYDGTLPGVKAIEGINFAHFITSGVKGLPISGEHPAYSLITKRLQSTVVGHLHTVDYSLRTAVDGRRVQAIVAGCYTDYQPDWAGKQQYALWWPGLIVLHNVKDGQFDPQFVSLDWLKREYSTHS